MRSGRKLPRRAGSSGPPGPVTRAAADLAVAALYYLHYRPLVRLAALLVPDLVTAETIVQDAFVDLYTVWPDLLGDSAAIVFLRRRVVDRSRSAPAGHGPGYPGLPAVLWALPARQREVLVLQYFADLPEAQVAAAAGISEAAVRSQVALAFSALRTELPPLS
jgi:DNA-directed RNA polymerase specialized sigma24 family protein